MIEQNCMEEVKEEIKTEIKTEPAMEAAVKNKSRVEKINEHFSAIGLATLVFAVFYTFCLYQNLVGITFPLFVGGVYVYFLFCMKQLEILMKKDAWFYMGSSLLLGISTFCTDSLPIQIFNFMGILLLICSFMVHQVYDDRKWDFSKYLGTVAYTAIASILHIFQPFIHLNHFLKKRSKKENSKGKYVVYGLFITVPLLIIVMGLLTKADIVFNQIFIKAYKQLDLIDKDVFGVISLTIFAFFASYSFLCSVVSKNISEEMKEKRTAEPVIAITFTSVLTSVYLIFCTIQVFYLFIGGLKLPEGYSYADYARSGYFQLLFVCLLNLVMVLICLHYFREHKVLKVILTMICGCTFIMIISSLYRMLLYINAYQLTFTRVLVLWSLLVLNILLIGIVIYIFKNEFSLFRFCIIVVSVSYMCLSVSHQDYWIAKYNVAATMNHATETDRNYLYQLSADAAPIVISLDYNMEEKDDYTTKFYFENRDSYLERIQSEGEELSIRSFNLSKWIAYREAVK